ncbi:hypothetical protein U9M48_002136 [Paspalum notatum var. saurae]|uniref:Receptor kinase-like protein Xa21 n=1 Tax=Paspalum notatum var. saurae TaxID=547442 RepID=A0AAQ3PPU5_PASNO
MKKILLISWPWAWKISMLTLLTNILFVSPLSTNYSDFLALMSFKSHITDPKQALSSWDAASSNDTNTPDFCQWMGVSCGDRHHPGRVTAIRLQNLSLAGIISEDLGNLTQLHFLDLSSNKLVGDIPSSISNCRKLRTINLSANQFSGFVPGPFGLLSKLTVFNVGHNNLTGEILTTLSNLTALVTIDTDRNAFNGPIPSRLSNLTSLSDLILTMNSFSGNIPADLGKITNLVKFDVVNNNLEGLVPPSLFNISSLQFLSLGFNQISGSLPLDIGFRLPRINVLGIFESNNQFEGTIPASLSNASELRYLLLRGNRLHGLIPRDIGIHGNLKLFSVGYNELQANTTSDWDFLTSLTNCSKLNILDLEQNNFAGVMPNSITNLSQELKRLTFSRNHIAGTPALWLGRFRKLIKLLLNNNLFKGTLPIDIGQLSSLQYLDLSHNGFEGQIPQSLGNITRLSNLSLSNNFLDGSIPASLGNLTNIGSMDLSCNLLEGQIPQEILTIPSLTILLSLSTNALSGTILPQIGHLNSLGKIDLSMNKLVGEIPEAIESCVQLRFLYLQGNLLQGKIPKRLDTLVVLEKLDLSSNNLTGPIPNFLETSRTLNYLNLSFNNLSGPVPDTAVFCNATKFSLTANTMLCGGPPCLQLPSCPSIDSHKASHYRLHIIIFCILGALIFCVCSVTAYCFIRRRMAPTFVDTGYLFLNENHERISYAELLAATESFSPANLIGSGSSGNVYIGTLSSDKNLATVAIKVLDLSKRGASRSFIAECNALRRIRHRKLVKVITVCSGLDHNGKEFKALVLEYICNGSLDEWLHPDNTTNSMKRKRLSLIKRLHIALDVAEALEYLHQNIDPPIVHCDIKPRNILLDDDLVAHVTDFGLAKIMQSEAFKKSHPEPESSSLAIKGTIGYVPPEYGSGSEVSIEGDIYCYGVLLLEMFTGRRPPESLNDGVANIVNYVRKAYPNDLQGILDATAAYSRDTYTQDIDTLIYPIFRLALACCKDFPRQRMKMHNVVEELNAIKKACAVHMVSST